MKLLMSGASPYVAMTAMAARLAEIELEMVTVDAANGDDTLLAANPLGKIPCLVLDDGRAIYDSRAILRFLDRKSGGSLYPADHDALTAAEHTEALCMGIADCAVASIYELRLRPEEKVHQPFLDRQWGKIERGLDAVMADLPPLGDGAHVGTLTLAGLLGYLGLRFARRWEDGRQALVDWNTRFDETHPELASLKPHG